MIVAVSKLSYTNGINGYATNIGEKREIDKKNSTEDPYSIQDLEKARRYLSEEISHRLQLQKMHLKDNQSEVE